MNPQIQIFHGPNKFAGVAGVVMEFEPPFSATLSAESIEVHWQKLDDTESKSLWADTKPDNKLSFVDVYASITSYFLQPVAIGNDTNITHGQTENSARSWVFLGHIHPETARLILHSALLLTNEIFSLIVMGHPGNNKFRPNPIENIRKQIASRHYSKTAQILLAVALSRGIPTYPISLGGNIWQYGQGSLGRHYRSAADEYDSLTGNILCRNKVWSNELINRLGFPGVIHGVARNPNHATRIAARIGYPVVTKPISAGMGKGITTSIDNPAELYTAFKLAAKISPQGVIIERYVKGTDHRLAVFGGELLWVRARYPARVVGDGVHSITTLIEHENLRRKGEINRKPIMQDTAMNNLLAKKGLSYDYCPAPGEEIHLRSVANISMGGTMEEVISRIHPDNRYMALALARAFRMDAIGIDFITEDISKSWRESSCAVIEVNETPGVLSYTRGAKVLNRMFPPGNDGRIPSILLVDSTPELANQVVAILQDAALRVGQAGASQTLLDKQARGKTSDPLHARVNSLISDPACEAIVVSISEESIVKDGFPLDKFDFALLPGDLSSDTANFIQMYCSQVEFYNHGQPGNTSIQNTLNGLVSKYRSNMTGSPH